jgi:transglutaminase-like putative cysteine protease
MRSLICFIVAVLAISCNRSTDNPQELPAPVAAKVSIDEIEAGIKSYIDQQTKANGGYFLVNDRGKEFRMKLVRVHTEYLANVGMKRFFACVDLADETGDVYDVDFFLAGEAGHMEVTETTVHKLNGKPFYAWKQSKDKTWNRVEVEEASTRLLGVIEGRDEFEFSYQISIPNISVVAKMWVPIATSDAYQTIEVLSMAVPAEYRLLRDADYGNVILYTELQPSDTEQMLEIRYRVKRMEKGPFSDHSGPTPLDLQPNALIPLGGKFHEIAEKAMAGREGDLMRARALYDYVIDNMRYMKFGTYGTGDANHACDARTGNCTEFHSLFIALTRSAGIPARFAVGASIPSERNEGGIDGYHCWAECYIDGKWWPVDISEANKYTALATYYFGHHPANRVELSRGRDLKVEPGPQSGPINFLAFPVLEVDGQTTAAKTYFSFKRAEETPI